MATLVLVASRHGSTREIGEIIAKELRAAGQPAEVHDVVRAPSLEGFDAVVLGSGVYVGKWLPDARRFIERNLATLTRIPVWLFSSGPLGEARPLPDGDPAEVPHLMQLTAARNHHVFAGRREKAGLGWTERLAVRAVGAPYGDFREWKLIRAWAREIAHALSTVGEPRRS